MDEVGMQVHVVALLLQFASLAFTLIAILEQLTENKRLERE
jgi:hypothetical protein